MSRVSVVVVGVMSIMLAARAQAHSPQLQDKATQGSPHVDQKQGHHGPKTVHDTRPARPVETDEKVRAVGNSAVNPHTVDVVDAELARAERELESNVRMTLLRKLGNDALRIRVAALGNQVWLVGQVRERATAKLAGEVTKSIDGVSRVRNDIRVMKKGRKGNRDDDNPYRKYDPASKVDPGERDKKFGERAINDGILEARVGVALVRILGEGAGKLEVEAVDGIVSVRGEVKDEDERRKVLNALRPLPGLRDVVDLMDTQKN